MKKDHHFTETVILLQSQCRQDNPEQMKHGDCCDLSFSDGKAYGRLQNNAASIRIVSFRGLILGYSHAFRLVVRSPSGELMLRTASWIILDMADCEFFGCDRIQPQSG